MSLKYNDDDMAAEYWPACYLLNSRSLTKD